MATASEAKDSLVWFPTLFFDRDLFREGVRARTLKPVLEEDNFLMPIRAPVFSSVLSGSVELATGRLSWILTLFLFPKQMSFPFMQLYVNIKEEKQINCGIMLL
jgi:hypothetical protein